MRALRVKFDAWTSSFRFPSFMVSYQPTLPIPPPSTIYGLISAARGEPTGPDDISMGYVFLSEGKGKDLETVYELSTELSGKSNVITREILFDCTLYLYLEDLSFLRYFKRPAYQLLLGRSSDIASVSQIKEIELTERPNVRFGHTVVPFGTDGAFGIVQALPSHFIDTVPRIARNVRRYLVMGGFGNSQKSLPYDSENDWSVYFHKGN